MKKLRTPIIAMNIRSLLLSGIVLTLALLALTWWYSPAQAGVDDDGPSPDNATVLQAEDHELPGLDELAAFPRVDVQPVRSLVQASPLVKSGASPQLEERFGVPTFLWAATAVSDPAKGRMDPETQARDYLRQYAELYGLRPSDMASARRVWVHDIGSGAIIVKFREQVNGVDVFREEMGVAMDRDLRLISLSGYLSGAARRIGNQRDTAFELSPRQAVAIGLTDLSGRNVGPSDLAIAENDRGPYSYYGYTTDKLASGSSRLNTPARIKKVYFHLPGRFEPAYYIELDAAADNGDSSSAYSYVISATDGRLLFRSNLTVSDQFSYRVWAEPTGIKLPEDGPASDYSPHPTGMPNGFQPPFSLPALISLQNGPISTNDPWLAAGATETNGNNVDAYTDANAPDGLTAGDFRATSTGAGVFDRTYDHTSGPMVNTGQQMGAITQLFYTNNYLHDWFYDAGFNEVSGNAQTNNYGRGGIAGDNIRAEAQDNYFGGSRNNANMLTPADGGRPKMQMYVWDGAPSPANIVINLQSGTTLPPTITPVGLASFGAQSFNITAAVAIVNDGVGTTDDGCEASSPWPGVTGKIVLIARGTCTALMKVQNAQSMGAVGVIIANNAASGLPPMTGTNASITIGALSVDLNTGNAFRTAIAAGTVNATLNRGPAGPERSGELDNQVVAHEWGHYISNRLIGNASGLGNNQGRGMGEGWGDFTALLMTVRAGDNFNGVYPISGYASVSQSSNFNSYYFGIRRFPYSIDTTKNGLNFRHIADGQALPPTPINGGGQNSEVHNTGEVWASMLWECYAGLLADTVGATPRMTFDQARNRMRAYVVAGYKMTPVQPTFVEARNSILTAAVANDPVDFQVFCAAFARRGIGMGAVAPDRLSVDNSPVTESFVCGPATTGGRVTFRNEPFPVPPVPTPTVAVPNVVINAAGSPSLFTTTNANGDYALSGFGPGTYTVTPSRSAYTSNQNNGIFSNDAALIARHVVGLITLSQAQIEAGTVNSTGLPLSAQDASLVAQWIVGINLPTNRTGQWRFTPPLTTPIVLIDNTQNYAGLLLGDVSGDWNPVGPRPAPPWLLAANKRETFMASIERHSAVTGSEIVIPVRLDGLGDTSVDSYQFDIEFDPDVITPAEIAASLAGTRASGLSIAYNTPQKGILKVVVYGAMRVTGDGVYANLRFLANGKPGEGTPISIRHFFLGDSTRNVLTADGHLMIIDDVKR